MHYDPGYTASTRENFPNVTGAVELADPTPAGFDRLAGELLAAERAVGAA